MHSWPEEEAKARLNELIDACATHGPQTVTRDGVALAVLVSTAQWRGLQEVPLSSLKQMLMSNEGRFELCIPPRTQRRRQPSSLD